MASIAFKGGVPMEKEALRKLWLCDQSGFTETCYARQERIQEEMEESRTDPTNHRSMLEQLPERRFDNILRRNSDEENGYFCILLSKENLDNTNDESDGSGKEGNSAMNEEDEEDEEDDEDLKVLAQSEMKRLSAKWMKPLLLNIDGMNKWDDGKEEEALAVFQQAAEVDSTNINALRHCRYVLGKMSRQSEADDVSRRIQGLVASGGRLLQARTEAELGMVIKALFYITELGSVTGRLVHAIELAGDEVPPAEIEFWRLNLAESFFWWYIYRWQNGIPGCLEMLEKAIELYCQVATSNNADNITRAQALRQLGDFWIGRNDHFRPIIERVSRNLNILRGSTYPEDYIREASSLDPDSSTIRIEYSTYLMRKRKLDEAKIMLDEAFVLDVGERHYHAYAMRGELCIKLYNRDKDAKHLVTAIKDLRYVIDHAGYQSYTIGMLGTAHYLLTMHENPVFLGKEEIAPALQAYEVAVYLLGYRRNALTHFHYAECLADYGYLRKAIESSKRAIEHDFMRKNLNIILNFMKQLLHHYNNEKKPDHIMSECVFWMDLICQKYSEYHVRNLLSELYEIHRTALVRVYHNLLYNQLEETARLFTIAIRDFRPWCPHPAKGFIAPPPISVPHNILGKPYDFLLLHGASDTAWVNCSFLPKMEQLYGLKACILGRDIPAPAQDEGMLAQVVSMMVPVQPKESSDSTESNVGFDEAESDLESAENPHTASFSLNQGSSTASDHAQESSEKDSDQVRKSENAKNGSRTNESDTNKQWPAIQLPKYSGETLNDIDGKPLYVERRRVMADDIGTPERSACLIILLTPALLDSPWFEAAAAAAEEDGEDNAGGGEQRRQPHPRLRQLMTAYRYVMVLRWDTSLNCAKLLRPFIKVFDCSELVHWDKIASLVQQSGGKYVERNLADGSMIPITDPFII